MARALPAGQIPEIGRKKVLQKTMILSRVYKLGYTTWGFLLWVQFCHIFALFQNHLH